MAGALLEICVASVSDALTAAEAGADRLELNYALGLGGLTPSLGTVLEVKARVHLPVMVLIRPRAGDFVYNGIELDVMCRDIDLALDAGAEGVVFGVLDAHGGIESKACTKLRTRLGGQQAIYHRAFDFCVDPAQAMEQLIDLGFHRILTSGRARTALEGADRIAAMKAQARGRIEILPAGGISPDNVASIIERTGCDQVHASVRRLRAPAGLMASDALLNAATLPPDDSFEETNSDAVRAIKKRLYS